MEFTQNQNVYAEVVQKAWEDSQFKSELMANPVEAIEKATGHKLNLPEGKTLVVRDQTDESVVYINIPAKLNTEDVELNEDQLEAVAGGNANGGLFMIAPSFPPFTTSPVSPSDFADYIS
jgi:hypothetical protein